MSPPAAVQSTTEGLIGRWLKREGDRVEQGDELVEIETDKATVAYPSPQGGYLQIVAVEGTTVAVGDVLARLTAEPVDASTPLPVPVPEDAEIQAEAEAEAEAAAEAVTGALVSHVTKPQASGPASSANGAAAAHADPQHGVRATPLARQLSREHGLSLATIEGSGPRGRVTRGDVMSRLGLPTPATPPLATPTPGPPTQARAFHGKDTRHELSRAQQTIARRMSESHASVPSFQVETEVVMDRITSLRQELKGMGDAGPVPSLNDFVIRASALALRQHPLANASFQDGSFLLFAHVSVGVAVATDGALLVPTIADADTRSLFEIAAETIGLAERARAGTLTPADLTGATFTVSNLGMFGMTAITPIVDVPQAAILGVGAVRETLALSDGVVVPRQLMTLRLSCDHRILYGADAARFLSTIRDLLAQPLRLLR